MTDFFYKRDKSDFDIVVANNDIILTRENPNKVNKAAKTDDTVTPTPIPIIEPVTLSIPNLLTITSIAPAIINV